MGAWGSADEERVGGEAACGRCEEGAVGRGERLSPMFNDMFLRLFGRQDSEPVTKPFLNAVLRMAGLPEVEGIDKIWADAASPGSVTCRTPHCDVVLECGNRLFDLEPERKRVNIGAKLLFYALRLMGERAPKGSDGEYRDLPQVVSIMLLDEWKAFPRDDVIMRTAGMQWKGGEGLATVATDRLLFVLVELRKVAERYNGHLEEVLADESIAWLYFLAGGYSDKQEADSIMSAFPTMEEFAQQYAIALDDPDLKRIYRQYTDSILEYNSIMGEMKREAMREGRVEGLEEGLKAGREAGLKEGREEGLKEGRKGLADHLRALGVDEATLQRALEYSSTG